MKTILFLAGGAAVAYIIAKPKFRTRCDGTVGDAFCNQWCGILGPYSSSGGKMMCGGVLVGTQPQSATSGGTAPVSLPSGVAGFFGSYRRRYGR